MDEQSAVDLQQVLPPPSSGERVIRGREEILRHLKWKMSKNIQPKAPRKPIYKEDLLKTYEEQTKEYVGMALDHYNATTKGHKYELLESFGSSAICACGYWIHVCFLAKPICSSADALPRHFFGEVSCPIGKEKSISCCIVDPKSEDAMDGCGSCPPDKQLYHPKEGLEAGNYPYEDRSCPMPANYYDDSVPMDRRITMLFS